MAARGSGGGGKPLGALSTSRQVFKVLGRFAAARPGLLERAAALETRAGAEKLQRLSLKLPDEATSTHELPVPPSDSVPLIQRRGAWSSPLSLKIY